MNEEELEMLFKKHMKLARITLYKVFPKPRSTARRKGLDIEDMYQYAYTGLWKACISYDPEKGTSFRTHAINHIRWHLIEKAKREGNPFKFDANKDIDFDDLPRVNSMDKCVNLGSVEANCLHDLVGSSIVVEGDAVDDLFMQELFSFAKTEDEIQIIKLRMEKDLTYKEIGEQYYGGQTGENMRARIRKLKDKMQKHIKEATMV